VRSQCRWKKSSRELLTRYNMAKNMEEKLITASGTLSGATSVLGSWQVCHSVCLGIIALLSVIGITLVGMPLLFLTKIALPLWSLALAILMLTVILYLKKKCISKKMIVFNSGLLIAGVPFQSLQRFSIVFWITGGLVTSFATLWYIKERQQRRRKK
jgi:hypothetical protein